jgi:hypothetical protein
MDGSSNDHEADRADLARRAICCSEAADSDFSAVSALFGRTMPQHLYVKDIRLRPRGLDLDQVVGKFQSWQHQNIVSRRDQVTLICKVVGTDDVRHTPDATREERGDDDHEHDPY